MKIAALFSGGKDSVYALSIAQQYGWDITHLVSILPKNLDSWMYHSINIHLTRLLSDALNIPLVAKETTGEKEKELNDLENLLQTLPIDGVISGAIASEYQRTRIERICHNLHIRSFTPLWHKDQTRLLKDQVNAGFHIIIVGVYADGFSEEWLGKKIDHEVIHDLERLHKGKSINTAGEGGEFETLVIDGPLFHKRIQIEDSTISWHRDNGSYYIQKARIVEKD
ncbi:MAG: TIGR00289 family protein [Candidatus Thermoplasmatota archaeon]|nr:TIGR00289 family protein [Candidatus Thermoplasmatota archaeon]